MATSAKSKNKEVLTTFEAARLCNVSYNTIKNWIKRDLLGAYRTAGGHLRIKLSDLEIFCREHKIPIDMKTGPEVRKVLIVDDEESIRIALKETLKQYPDPLEIYTASDGFEAGTIMQAMRPDMLVLDLVMPGMDGFKVCQIVRRSAELKHAKIVVLTGFPSDKNFERATELGADICLAKPLNREKLFDTFESLLIPRRGVRRRRTKSEKNKK